MNGFKKNFAVLGLLAFLTACSSIPERVSSDEAKKEYVAQTEKTLDAYEKRARKLNSIEADRLQAWVSDARIDLRRIEVAPDPTWLSVKQRVDTKLSQLEVNFGAAD